MICSKYMVGKDGKTLYERRRGKKFNLVVVPFGERVLYKQIRKARIGGPSSRLRTKKASGWDTIGEPTRRSSELHTVWSKLTLSAGEMTPHDGARALISGMKGTPKQPDPSKPGIHIPIKNADDWS